VTRQVRNGFERAEWDVCKRNRKKIAQGPIFFDVHVTVHRDKFLIIRPTRCTNFSKLFLE
jgi:hypothetical protein